MKIMLPVLGKQSKISSFYRGKTKIFGRPAGVALASLPHVLYSCFSECKPSVLPVTDKSNLCTFCIWNPKHHKIYGLFVPGEAFPELLTTVDPMLNS